MRLTVLLLEKTLSETVYKYRSAHETQLGCVLTRSVRFCDGRRGISFTSAEMAPDTGSSQICTPAHHRRMTEKWPPRGTISMMDLTWQRPAGRVSAPGKQEARCSRRRRRAERRRTQRRIGPGSRLISATSRCSQCAHFCRVREPVDPLKVKEGRRELMLPPDTPFASIVVGSLMLSCSTGRVAFRN